MPIYSYDDADRAAREGTRLALLHARSENRTLLKGLCDEAIDALCELAGETQDIAILAGHAHRIVSRIHQVGRTLDSIESELQEVIDP